MKSILLWDPRFPDRRPARLSVDDAVASAAVRAGVAAAANSAQAGELSAGPALDPGMLTEVMIQHGASGATRRMPTRDNVPLPAAGRVQLANNPIFASGSGGVLGTVSAAGSTTTSGSDTVAVTLAAGLPVGVPVTGAGIPAGTTILSRPATGGAGNYVLSNAATASATITMVASGIAAGSVVPANCTAVTAGGATMSTSVVADATGIGNNVILTPKFLAAGDIVRLVSDITLANWSPGDIVEAYAEIEVYGASNLRPIQLELSTSGTNSSGVQVGPPTQDMNVGASTVGPDEDYILFERTKVIQIPTTMTTKAFMSVGLRCIAAQAAAAGATSIRIRRLVVNRLPALPY